MSITHSFCLRLRSDHISTQLLALQELADREQVKGLTLPVVEAVASGNPEIQSWAIEVIKRSLVPEPDEVVPLCDLMETSQNASQVEHAALMLGKLGNGSESAEKVAVVLLDAFKRIQHTSARERIVWALAQLGPAAMVAEEALKQTVEDASPRLKRMATEALRRLSAA